MIGEQGETGAKVAALPIRPVDEIEVTTVVVTTPAVEAKPTVEKAVETKPAKRSTQDKGPSQANAIFAHAAGILAREQHFAIGPDDQLFRYEQGRYVPKAAQWIHGWFKSFLVQHRLSELWRPDQANRLVSYLQIGQPMLWPAPPSHLINLENGILDLRSLMMLDHSPGWLSTIQLPIQWDPSAPTVEWDNFILSLFPADAVQFAYEIIGSCLVPNPDIQEIPFLSGSGSNGKSTFIEALCGLLGNSNVSRISVPDISENRFAAAGLEGKLLNVDTDVEIGRWKSVAPLKKITGGDGIRAENKGEKAFDFKPFCRLLLSGNELPDSKDVTHGFFRRLLIVPFLANFKPVSDGGAQNGAKNGANGAHSPLPRAAGAQSSILERLLTPQSRSGALIRGVQALRQLQFARKFSSPASIASASTEFRQLRDVHHDMITQICRHLEVEEPQPQKSHVTHPGWHASWFKDKVWVYDFYLKWCKENRRAPQSMAFLTKWLKANAPAAFVIVRPRPSNEPREAPRARGWAIWPHLLPAVVDEAAREVDDDEDDADGAGVDVDYVIDVAIADVPGAPKPGEDPLLTLPPPVV